MKSFISLFAILLMLTSTVGFAMPSRIMENSPENMAIKGTLGVNTPPGLQNKKYPPGLQKQAKVPYGWSQGKKEGWTLHKPFTKKHFKHKHPIVKKHHD